MFFLIQVYCAYNLSDTSCLEKNPLYGFSEDLSMDDFLDDRERTISPLRYSD